MNKQDFIELIKYRIEEEQKRYNHISESDFLERGLSLGRINGLLQAWEIAQHMGD